VINTVAAVFAGPMATIVNILLAIDAGESWRTSALVVAQQVQTGAAMLAGV
jgi:hypothetical protein